LPRNSEVSLIDNNHREGIRRTSAERSALDVIGS
jgi:hypothetical protein